MTRRRLLASRRATASPGGGAATLFDNFDRTSTTSPGTADSGQAWTARGGTWGTDGDRLHSVTAADGDQATIDLGAAGQDVTITLAQGVVSGTAAAVLARWENVNRFYALSVDGAAGKAELIRWDPYANLAATANGIVANGSGLRLTVAEEEGGTRLRAYVNGVERLSFLDTNPLRPLAGTHIGVRHGAYTGGLSIRWNNLTGSPDVATPGEAWSASATWTDADPWPGPHS